MVIKESRVEFTFPDSYEAVKFDETAFYRKRYNHVEGSKGVDVVAGDKETYYIIEVKDCSRTAEDQDKWRRAYHGLQDMNSLANEIVQKVAHTCACMYGASTFGDRTSDSAECLATAVL